MPNTLAHIGINGLLTRTLIKKSDFFWIYFGTIIPDLPWIFQRVVETFFPSINGYDLRLFVIVQATLILSIILSGAIAFISNSPKKTFLILSFGSLLHLLLDSLQIKWANGVHLFAPFNWELLNFSLFWPESFPTYILTIAGIIYFIFNWNNLKLNNIKLKLSFSQLRISFFLFVIYFTLPFGLMQFPLEQNNHFVQTLSDYENRTGKPIELDRKKMKFEELTKSYFIESIDKSYIKLVGIETTNAYKISVKGKFIDNNTIKVTEFHEHIIWFRDGASYIGLGFILLTGMISFKIKNRTIQFN